MVENKDFTIDYQKQEISFQYDISGVSLITLIYYFVGLFAVREFLQEFLVDIYDDTIINIEKWASLINGIFLTNHNELIDYYNIQDKTEYSAANYLTTHTINQVHLLDGTSDRSGTIAKLQLKFKVAGQMKLVKELKDGYGLIDKIHSPGKILLHSVDIEFEVG